MVCAAIYILLHTGCRLSEAAYVVYHKSIVASDYFVPHMKHPFKATMPRSVTKTSRDYFWLLPKYTIEFVSIIKKLASTGFPDFKALARALGPYYDTQVLAKAGVAAKDKQGNSYSMRTIRAARATEWVLLKEEYDAMKWEPHPPNPLQHTNIKMTLTNYATKGVDNVWEAKRRCVEKYGRDPDLR